MTSRAARVLLAAPLLVGVTLTACGSDDDDETPPATDAPVESDPPDDGNGALDGAGDPPDDGNGALDGADEDSDE